MTGQEFVVRRDRKPRIQETVETLIIFMFLSNSIPLRTRIGSAWPHPNGFPSVLEEYWTKEATKLEQGNKDILLFTELAGLIKWVRYTRCSEQGGSLKLEMTNQSTSGERILRSATMQGPTEPWNQPVK